MRSILWQKARRAKEAAIQFVKDKLNIEVTSDEADAITLGYAGIIEKEQNKSAF